MTEVWTPGFIAGPIKMGQLMAIFALGALLAQPKFGRQRLAVFVLLAFVVVGAGLAYIIELDSWVALLLFAATALAGGIVAAGVAPAMPFSLALTAFVALVLGLASRPYGGRFPDQWVVLLVNLAGAVVLPLLIALICRRLQAQTERAKIASIGIRIAASWDTAIAAMMVALIGVQAT